MKRKISLFENFGRRIINELNKKDILAYVYHIGSRSKTTYIRFKDPKMASIRIGDHPGNEKWRYKFNVRKDIRKFKATNDRGITRLFYPLSEKGFKLLIKDLEERKSMSKTWKGYRESYALPDYKRKQYEKEKNEWI